MPGDEQQAGQASHGSWESPVVEILKVSSKSNPNSVAGALAGVVRGAGSVEMQVVGAGALNQAVKALAIARNYVANSGMDLACRPTFADIFIDGEERTAIRLLVEKFAPRTRAEPSPAPAIAGEGDGTGPISAAAGIDSTERQVQGGAPASGSPVPVVQA